jgi:hypothetical protein
MPTEAVRIADEKAREAGHDPKLYRVWHAHYEASDGSWWVEYRRPTAQRDAFCVRVEDKTKRAYFVTID